MSREGQVLGGLEFGQPAAALSNHAARLSSSLVRSNSLIWTNVWHSIALEFVTGMNQEHVQRETLSNPTNFCTHSTSRSAEKRNRASHPDQRYDARQLQF